MTSGGNVSQKKKGKPYVFDIFEHNKKLFPSVREVRDKLIHRNEQNMDKYNAIIKSRGKSM